MGSNWLIALVAMSSSMLYLPYGSANTTLFSISHIVMCISYYLNLLMTSWLGFFNLCKRRFEHNYRYNVRKVIGYIAY